MGMTGMGMQLATIQQSESAPGSRVIAASLFDNRQRLDAMAPAGSTIGEIVDFALPGATPDVMPWVRVSIGNDIVPREYWRQVRPKPSTIVVVQILPGNSGILRASLSIAVAVAAMALGQYYAVPLAGSAVGAALGLTPATAGSIITATTLIAGSLLVNALVPIRQDRSSSTGLAESPTYSIQGFRNVPNPDGIIPCVLGKVRFAPPYAALPYTEVNNGETYVRALFLLGYGPLYIDPDKIRIGDTPILRFNEVEVEVRQGYASDDPITIYNRQVLEERLSIEARKGDVNSRFTASDADEVQIDVIFPSGLFWMHTVRSGSTSTTQPLDMNVVIRVSYRLEGVGAWTVHSDWNIWGKTQKAFSTSMGFKFPARGRYEIKLERQTDNLDDLNGFDQDNQFVTISVWSAIRSFRPEYPINFDKPLALIAVRVRASKQLNGVLDNLNCEASRICKDWDSGTQTWIERETQNPASLYRYALQSTAVAYPLADGEIDLAQLQDWHAFCADESLKYNRVHDYEASIYDVMGDVAAAGRAAPRDDGTKWGVVIDRKQTITIAHMTPRNSWNFSGERPYVVFPDAFRAKFFDETNDYKPAERVVPRPGFVGTPAVVESIGIPGVTNPDQVWLDVRKRWYELIYRRDVFNVMQDFEGAIARRGDLIRLSHDVLVSTQRAARVRAVSGNTVALDDWVTMEVGKTYAIRIRKLSTTENGNDTSVLRAIQTVVGDSNSVIMTDTGVAPEVGDLVMFGESGIETMECIVREAEGAEDFARHFTLIPHAPEIFDLLAAETPPAWNGRVGAEVGGPAGPSLDFSDPDNSQYIFMGWP